MSAYRFCRTDDIPLLVDAWNRCGLPHFPNTPSLTIADFKQEIRELDLWCSSCMVAFDGKDPIAVMHGCKRPPHTLVHRIAIHPDHLRKGHGRHLLTSLSAKLAILGPPLLVAEIPAENAAARALFTGCGWKEERTYTDFIAESPMASPAPPGLVVPVTVGDLTDFALPAADAPRSWARSRATLLARRERLSGLAIAHGEGLDASVLYTREGDGPVLAWNLFATPSPSGREALGVILRDMAERARTPLAIMRAERSEVDAALLQQLGFTPARVSLGVATVARSA